MIELPVGPRGRDAEAGMDQDHGGVLQGGKKIEWLNDFAAARGQGRFVLQKKWNIGPERRGGQLQLAGIERVRKNFVQGEEGGRAEAGRGGEECRSRGP